MKVKLLNHHEEWIDGDFEPPQNLKDSIEVNTFRVHRDVGTGRISLAIPGEGTGIWESDGTLVSFFEKASDLEFSSSKSLWLVEPIGGDCRAAHIVGKFGGIRHGIKELDKETLRVLSKFEICSEFMVNYIILSHSESTALVTWLEQNQWGYVLVDLERKQSLPLSLYWLSPTLSPPAFSPSDGFVVSCHLERSAWWNDEFDDPSEIPSPGGRRRIGTISVHNMEKDEIQSSEVLVDLPEGWMPEEPYSSKWKRIWGPEFIAENEFRVWLPDGTEEILKLPLPESVLIERGLRTFREWNDY